MKAEKLLEHIKYLQNEWYESEIENLKLKDQVEEFVEWNQKEEQHKEELQQHNTELEIENRKLKAEIIQFQLRNTELVIQKKEAKEELQQKREEISRLTIEQNGGPVAMPVDDLPDFEQ